MGFWKLGLNETKLTPGVELGLLGVKIIIQGAGSKKTERA